MLKSTLRLIASPVLSKNILADGRLISMSLRLNAITFRNIHTTSLRSKEVRRQREKVRVGATIGTKYKFTEGENTIETLNISQQKDLFPDADTPNKLFNGVPFKELHAVNIKSTPNNTIMSLTEHKGKILSIHSSGIEGFKNAKKGTNIAAQQAAITFGKRILKFGVDTVRVRVQGLGAGRMSSIKGLQMTGLNIVSITDDTRVSYNPPRPRKQRRV